MWILLNYEFVKIHLEMGSHLQMWYHLQMWAHRQMVYQPGVPTLIPPSNRVPFLKAPPPLQWGHGVAVPRVSHTTLPGGVLSASWWKAKKMCAGAKKSEWNFFLKNGSGETRKNAKSAILLGRSLFWQKKSAPGRGPSLLFRFGGGEESGSWILFCKTQSGLPTLWWAPC